MKYDELEFKIPQENEDYPECSEFVTSSVESIIQIIEGEALEQLPHIPSESVDLIIADPPYNLGKEYENNYDRKEFDEYLQFSTLWLTEACRILKPTGTIYVFMGFRCISYLYDILARDLQMCFNNWICWHYTQGMGKTKGFSPRHDDILNQTSIENYRQNGCPCSR